MTDDLPDEAWQREFEVGLDRKLLSICLARRGHVYLIDNHAMEKVERVVEKWRRRVAKAKPVASDCRPRSCTCQEERPRSSPASAPNAAPAA
jgi:hypothetical protein